MRQNTAVVIFSRTPQLARKNADEPYAALPWDDVDALFTALLADSLENACRMNDADLLLFRDEEEFSEEFLEPFKGKVRCHDLVSGSFSLAVHHAIETAFSEHYHRVLLLLDNNPVGIPARLRRMLDQLGQEDDCVVVSPTLEGKCAAIAMKANHSWVFDPAEADPLAKPHLLMQRLCTLPTIVIPTPVSYLLDSGSNLARFRAELDGLGQPEEGFPRRAYEMFRSFDKKYKPRKAVR
jgi:hypothetical protein